MSLNLIDIGTIRNKNTPYIKLILESLTPVISKLFTCTAFFVPCANVTGYLLFKVG